MNRVQECILATFAAGLFAACSPAPVTGDSGADTGRPVDATADTGVSPDVQPGTDAQPLVDAADAPPPMDVPADTVSADVVTADTVATDAVIATDVVATDAGGGHVVFVTSTQFNGNFGGLTGGDAICQGLATTAGLAGMFRAILSDSTTHANARITINGPVRDVMGMLIANNAADLWDGSIALNINRNERGAAVTANAWTGTSGDGTRDSSIVATTYCDNWAGLTAGVQAGSTIRTDARWIAVSSANGVPCDGMRRLYCISQ